MKLPHRVKVFLKKYGYAVAEPKQQSLDKDMQSDPLFVEVYEKTRPYTMVSPEKSFALYTATVHIARQGIPGDIVECGVWRGGQVMLMAYTLKALGDTSRKLYLYDTYKGMVEPDERDIRVGSGRPAREKWEEREHDAYNAWCYASLEDVKQNVLATGYPFENFVFVEGKVEETIPDILPEDIALLRLDTDWYESTYHELTHGFPRVAKGGVLFIDDYGCWQGSRTATDAYMAEHGIGILLLKAGKGRIGVKT